MTTEARSERSRPSSTGIILIVLGVLLLLDQMGVMDFVDFITTFWPLILIWFGVRMILFPKEEREPVPAAALVDEAETVGDGQMLHERRMLGDIRRVLKSQNFAGAKFEVTFGDIDVDARELGLQSGQRTLYASTIFGDVRLRLPQNVPYLVRANATAGELNLNGEHASGIFIQRSLKSNDFDGASTRLIIVVSVVFGDVQIW